MQRYFLTLVYSMCIMLFVSCSIDSITGSGNLTSEIRNLNSFNAVSVVGVFEVNIIQGDTQSVEIIADDNVISHVRTKIENGILKLYLDNNHNYKNISVSANITAVSLAGIKNEGSGEIVISQVSQPNLFYVNNKGSGNISFSGFSSGLNVRNEGSGTLSGFGFVTSTCDVELVGSGDLEITCEIELNVSISGSGNVFYNGNPTVNSNIDGSGNVIDSN